MSSKTYINTFVILILLPFVGFSAFAVDSENPAHVYSTRQEGQIGISEGAAVDNPFDNIFHIHVDQELCGDEEVWLTYDLHGVADHTAVARSVNDQIAFGGYLVKKATEWSTQKERIDVKWLKQGDNVIRFSVPGQAEYGYKVRNLKIEIGASEVSDRGVIINQPSLNYFGNKAYVKGYVQGQGSILKIGGETIETFNGEFEAFIEKPANFDAEEWMSLVEVSYVDGSSICETLHFSQKIDTDYSYEAISFYGRAEKSFAVDKAEYLQFGGASIYVPANALPFSSTLSITALRSVDIPALDAGMVNVTAQHAGYRFLPHGTAFQKTASIVLPFDPEKIPAGYTEKDIKTYFFDEQSHHWVALPLDSVLSEEGQIWSKTTHFTDMINGIIKVPESPEVNAYNSTTMKGIKAANPTAAINLLQPPSANSMGNANMDYPLNLPAGRNGMQPQLALSYTNAGGNGWMGMGWNLSISSISIDTRWGVPRYDGQKETETYSMSGQQLYPVAHRSEPVARTAEKQFHPRIEGSFNKIIRHGNNPTNYWWEVTDKTGTRYCYGGKPSTGLDRDAILADGANGNSGNIAQWFLVEIRDLNGNFVSYSYDRVEDAGVSGGSVPGYELYCDKITYTGHGSTEGKYTVSFVTDRDEIGSATRKDVSIDGRLGFKRVTADLLKKVEVKFDGKPIRHYEFEYGEGAFFKTLLTAIREYDAGGALFTTHELEYYDEVRNGTTYNPFKSGEEWDPQRDNVDGNFITGKAGFEDDASALTGTESETFGFGMTVTVGFNDSQLTSKSNTLGGSVGYSQSDSEGRVMMIDLNGDGLPDKVIADGNGFRYRANLAGTEGSTEFSEPIDIINGSNFYKERSKTVNAGFEAQAGFGDAASAFVGTGYSNTKSLTSVYFTDVNGDQLTDLVKDGRVYFNSYNKETGVVTFTESSDATPSPIDQSQGIASDIFEIDPQEIEEAIDNNPLHDVVRMWRAPFDGNISITAPVNLIEPAESKERFDGVRVAVQHKGSELWAKRIESGDYTVYNPSGLGNINVDKGDQIYFRVQSVENGEADQVRWAPVIEYLDEDLNTKDANGKLLNSYSVEEDFVLTSAMEVTAPIDGQIRITGNFIKPETTDSIRVEIIRNNASGKIIELDYEYSWDESVNTPVNLTLDVEEGDSFRFRVSSSTNIDWPAIQWNPEMYYIASYDPDVPEVIQNGEHLIRFHPVPELTLFAKTLDYGTPWVVTNEIDSIRSVKGTPGTLRVAPHIAFPAATAFAFDGNIMFSVKKSDTLPLKQELTIVDGNITPVDTFSIVALLNDTIYFEFHTNNEFLAEGITQSTTDVVIGDSVFEADAGVYTVYTNEEDFIFGPLYRGWGHFAYNGNRDRASQPIDEDDLKLNDKLSKEYESGDVQNPDDLAAQDPYDPSTDNFIMFFTKGGTRVWSGYDEFTYLNATKISSSRLGDDDIRPFQGFDGGGGNAIRAINKINKSETISASGGGGAGPVSGSANVSTGWSRLISDFMDMNGDRYPDIVTEKGVQFTLPTGKLESTYGSLNSGVINKTTTDAAGVSIGGFYKTEPKGTMLNPKGVRSDAGSAKVSGTISGNFGTGTNEGDFTWTDVNGDGLPDRVRSNGMVALNLGYKLTNEEPWGHQNIQESESKSYGGGLGFSKGVGSESSSISAGIGVSLSDNNVMHSLQDVNGDGLADEVFVDEGVKVNLNTGNGFESTTYSWTGAPQITKSSTTSESANAAFTGCIPLPPPPLPSVIKLCFNPSGHAGQGMSRDLEKFTDIDGDGYPDYVISTKDDNLTVKRSAIGKTNMLKRVVRPLGASFALDYEQKGSTYDQPNNVWVLKEVKLFDGFAGDGLGGKAELDTMLTTFAYDSGLYDRHEREFYGFSRVETTVHDTGNGSTPYNRITQHFINDNYYEKGLLVKEIVADADGNLFTERINNYQLKDINNGSPLDDDFVSSDDGSAFPALIETIQKFYEGKSEAGKSTSMLYEYNAIGNVVSYTDLGDEGDEDDLFATITYHDVNSRYIKSMPSSIFVESSEGILRKREADIDQNTGKVIQIRQFLEDESVAIHDMTYDNYGNLKTITRPSNSADQRLSFEYTYDEEVHTYVNSVSNSYGYTSEATYDFRFGQVLETVDLNGNKITYTLDDLGRVEKIIGPYEQQGAPYTIKFEYHPEAEVPWALTKHYDPQNNNNDMETAIFVDGLGRVLQTKKDAAIFQGEGKPDKEMMVVSGRVLFDAFGRTVEAYYPTLEDTGNQGQFNHSFDTVDPTVTTYDVLNRVLTVKLPDGAITTTEYGFGSDRDSKKQFSTLITDANGTKTEQFTDVRGRVTAVKNYTSDGEVWTSFTYNAINEQITATDDMDNTTFSVFDMFGRRTERVHPDAGKTTYTYDLAGNLTELVTANLAESGGAITYSYDFERLTDISYPDNPENNVHYIYGASNAEHNRAGRVVIQEDASGAQEFFYGPLGEVVKNIRTVVIPQFDDQTYVTEWTYDTWNRLESMIYPDGEEVTFSYNVGGLLHSMNGKKKGAKFDYVDQLGYDKFEQRVFLEYGNGTKTNYTYEPNRRRLKTMTATTAANRNFMDNVYEYDQVNNILSLKNNAPVPKSNLMGGSSEYSYDYDDLYRLTSAQGHYTGSNEQHRYTLTMSYNTVGGILQKTQLHERAGGGGGSFNEQHKTTYDNAYTYGDTQPHAPIHIGEQAFTYDANGNQTGWTHDVSGQRREIIWDEENRIRAISDNGTNYHYTYDASGTRVLKGKSSGQSIYKNGKWKTGSGQMGNYTVYVNPYIVLKSGGYTKHYYIESQRIVSKLGGGFDNNGQGPLKAGEGKVNYNTKHEELFEGIVRNLKFLADDGSILTAGKSGKVPPGQIIGDSPTNAEQFQYFYHPDHLGSTSYITDASGEVYQHLEYFAFGETFVEEHSNTHRTPYLFNGKELDEETGLYYYGARYYDPQTSIFMSVDPAALKMPGWSPYNYTFNNPIKLTDPDGRIPIIPLLIKAGANAAADWFAQTAMNYYFNPETAGNLSASAGDVNRWQIARSGLEGLIPWKTPGGRLGRAALSGVGDVTANYLNDMEGYSTEQAVQDFAVGFIGDLAGGGLGELVSKYGSKSVVKGLGRMGFNYGRIAQMMGGGGLRSINRTVSGVSSRRMIEGWSGKVAVIGRNMSRVRAFASGVGGEVWDGFDPNLSQAENLANNRQWIQGLKEEGYTIYDVGLDPRYSSQGDMSKGAYYEMETSEIFGDN